MSKVICFISLGNQFLTPYLKKYTSIIECNYDIIYWNRYGIEESCGARQQYVYDLKIDEKASKLKKLKGYLLFAKYATKVIKQKKYNGIILATTSAGMILKGTLKRFYKKRYIIDIRDYTMESNKIFFQLEKQLLENAAICVISSEGYKKFLPKGRYTVTHNELSISSEIVGRFRNYGKRDSRKITLTNIGLIRFHEQNKKIIDIFINDPRFEIKFIGADAFALKEYCESKHTNNVTLVDRFNPEETFNLMNDTNAILNIYGNNTPLLDSALSNKLYYSAKLGIPILVCKNTFMEEISKGFGFGFTFDLDDPECKEQFLVYYSSINWTEFYQNCDRFLAKIESDEMIFKSTIEDFIARI